LDPFDHGTLFSIVCQIGRMVEWSVQSLKDQECFSKGQSDLHIILTRVAIEAIKIIQHNETIDTLLRRCFEKRLLLDPFMCYFDQIPTICLWSSWLWTAYHSRGIFTMH